MKAELKKLKGNTIKTSIGQVTLREYYRLEQSEYDQIYFKTSGIESICKLYDLSQPASQQRFRNEMQQYHAKVFNLIYDRIHCEQITTKKMNYGLILFIKLDKELTLKQCMSTLSGYERMKLTISLVELLQQLKEKKKIYCNIRPNNIYKCGDKFVIINAEFLRDQGARINMDSFMLENIQNTWQYWPAEVTDPYSNQPFDFSLDVYAIGCILYEVVAGKYPFESKLSAINSQYTKLQGKNHISKITEVFLSQSSKRRIINFKQILKKLRQCSNDVKPVQVEQQPVLDRKGTNNGGIFDNITNVFSKMMNDSEGWFLNYVQDNQEAPLQKYLDNILTKMYKKEEKSDKISSIIQKYVSNNQNKINSIRKALLMIGQAIRRGPETALHSFLPNILSIKSMYPSVKQIQEFCALLQKKVQVNDKLRRLLSGNFYLIQISNFKQLSISDLLSLTNYLQNLISYVQNRSHSNSNSDLSQAIINFACDQIYDLVSTIIFSLISIRKDNQIQLRNDNLKQLQPIEKIINICLRKLSNLSNFISAHAIYSLEGEYIPYQEEIMLKSNPYYTTLEYFYNSCKNYKGLTVPTHYASIFSSSFNRDDKKSVHSANKEVTKQSKNGSFQGNATKSYFKQEINSDEDDQFNRSGKVILDSRKKIIQNITVSVNDDKNAFKVQATKKIELTFKVGSKEVPKQNKLQEWGSKQSQESIRKANKNQQTISFEEFCNITKVKAAQSPPKDFNQFDFFNDDHKMKNSKKPPLPEKSKLAQVKITNKSFIDFDEIFDKNQPQKVTKSNLELKQKKVQPFDIFGSFLQEEVKKPEPENPLLKKILNGLKLKQLKDLLQKNKSFIIDFKQIKMVKVIGSGSAGEVYYGKYKQQEIAIKKVKAKENPNALKQFERELVTYIKIKKHPHLVSLVGLSEDNGDFYLITQYCSSGSLFDILHKKKLQIVLSWKQRLSFAIQIAQGMEFLHAMKPIIIHRDLKSLNVFVTKIGNNWKMKVADFGLSRSPEADMMTTQLGTIHWMAPELLEGKQYSYKVDVYSYGVLLWQILSRTTPYSNLQNPMAILKYVVIDRKRPSMQNIPKQCPSQLLSVMQKCWAHEPNDRPPFSEVIKQLKMINL